MNPTPASENARHLENVIQLLDDAIARLKKRGDSAGAFALTEYAKQRDQAKARLAAYRAALPKVEGARAKLELAETAFENKRAELLAEMERALEPAALRLQEARQAHDAATKLATLDRYFSPAAEHDGDTGVIAQHAPEILHYAGPGYANRCADAAFAQRNLPPAAIAKAIAQEADYLKAGKYGAGGEHDDARRAAFAFRWKHWATANGHAA
jgi:hypothetical protein